MLLDHPRSSMIRKTEQRRAIRDVITKSPRPLAIEEILVEAQKQVPRLGIATVYRTVKAFVSDGSVRVVSFSDAPNRYEVATNSHHHYFHCDRCGKVFDVPWCPGELNAVVPDGFEVSRHEITIYGLCRSCVGA